MNNNLRGKKRRMKRKIKKMPIDFLKRVKDTVRHYGMLKKGDRVLVAVSGGSDSVSLFRVLWALKDQLGIEIVVVNIDHGVRGEESERESGFVESLADEFSVECIRGKLKPFKSGAGKKSLEEKLRTKRYEFFVRVSKKNGCNVIATGHNMDDQAETVLMRMIKGSSSDGLAGIPPVRFEGDIKLIRPLIRTSKVEIMSFISKLGAEYVEDSSNADLKFLRNRIRNEVLPFLAKINPAIRSSLVNIADSVREETLFAAAVRKEKVKNILLLSRPRLSVSLKEYLAQISVVRREIFKELFIAAGGNVKKLSHRHWMLMDGFVSTHSKGRSLDLPGNTRVIKSRGKLTFIKSDGK